MNGVDGMGLMQHVYKTERCGTIANQREGLVGTINEGDGALKTEGTNPTPYLVEALTVARVHGRWQCRVSVCLGPVSFLLLSEERPL